MCSMYTAVEVEGSYISGLNQLSLSCGNLAHSHSDTRVEVEGEFITLGRSYLPIRFSLLGYASSCSSASQIQCSIVEISGVNMENIGTWELQIDENELFAFATNSSKTLGFMTETPKRFERFTKKDVLLNVTKMLLEIVLELLD